jgi:hypothetical protein
MKVRHIISIALLCASSNANAYSVSNFYSPIIFCLGYCDVAFSDALESGSMRQYKHHPSVYYFYKSSLRDWDGSKFCRFRYIPRVTVCKVVSHPVVPPVNPVPVPPAILLFGSALMGLLSIFKLKKV